VLPEFAAAPLVALVGVEVGAQQGDGPHPVALGTDAVLGRRGRRIRLAQPRRQLAVGGGGAGKGVQRRIGGVGDELAEPPALAVARPRGALAGDSLGEADGRAVLPAAL
jgi:hypothetical protein